MRVASGIAIRVAPRIGRFVRGIRYTLAINARPATWAVGRFLALAAGLSFMFAGADEDKGHKRGQKQQFFHDNSLAFRIKTREMHYI